MSRKTMHRMMTYLARGFSNQRMLRKGEDAAARPLAPLSGLRTRARARVVKALDWMYDEVLGQMR